MRCLGGVENASRENGTNSMTRRAWDQAIAETTLQTWLEKSKKCINQTYFQGHRQAMHQDAAEKCCVKHLPRVKHVAERFWWLRAFLLGMHVTIDVIPRNDVKACAAQRFRRACSDLTMSRLRHPSIPEPQGTFAPTCCCGTKIFKIMREIVLTIMSKLAVQFVCA